MGLFAVDDDVSNHPAADLVGADEGPGVDHHHAGDGLASRYVKPSDGWRILDVEGAFREAVEVLRNAAGHVERGCRHVYQHHHARARRLKAFQGLGVCVDQKRAALEAAKTVLRAASHVVEVRAGHDHEVEAIDLLDPLERVLTPLVAVGIGAVEMAAPHQGRGRRATDLREPRQEPTLVLGNPLDRREELLSVRVA